MTWRGQAVTLALFVLIAPATARASVAQIQYGDSGNADTVVYAAAEGETNAVTATVIGRTWTLRDAGAVIAAGNGCASVSEHEVRCPHHALTIETGDGDDMVNVPLATVDGGPGNDRLTSGGSVQGGPGDDTIVGGPSSDELYAGTGRDVVRGGGGDDYLSDGDYGGSFAPDVLDGGSGHDTALYGLETGRLDIALGSDGRELVHGDQLESVEGTEALDGPVRIVGTAGANVLESDSVFEPAVLIGRGGNDQITADGAARDTVRAGGGDDTIALPNSYDVEGFEPDDLSCGAGRDTVLVDYTRQVLPIGCERVTSPTEVTEPTWSLRQRVRGPGSAIARVTGAECQAAHGCRDKFVIATAARPRRALGRLVTRARPYHALARATIRITAAGWNLLRGRGVLRVLVRFYASDGVSMGFASELAPAKP